MSGSSARIIDAIPGHAENLSPAFVPNGVDEASSISLIWERVSPTLQSWDYPYGHVHILS
jgi:hypothetical protein